MTSLFMEVLVDSSVLVYIGDLGGLEIRSEREINVRYCFEPRLF